MIIITQVIRRSAHVYAKYDHFFKGGLVRFETRSQFFDDLAVHFLADSCVWIFLFASMIDTTKDLKLTRRAVCDEFSHELNILVAKKIDIADA